MSQDPQNVHTIVDAALLNLWATANQLARIRDTGGPFRVTVFGSSRLRPEHHFYGEVKRMAETLARSGCDIITGGGPGLMQAANEGARKGDPDDASGSVGIRVDLPFEQGANPSVGQVYDHETFFTRLHHFVRLSDAYVVVDGGVGTTLELLMIWQLLQVEHLDDVPLILVGPMWKELVGWARSNLIEGDIQLANPEHVDIPICVDTVDEAVELILGRMNPK